MKNYLDLCIKILNHGERRGDRTGTGTIGLFGEQLRFDLSKGFPLLTNKYTSFKLIATELLWFLSGSSNEKDLAKMGNNIWSEWADPKTGELGPVYGVQWRKWQSSFEDNTEASFYVSGVPVREIDQIKEVINSLKNNPKSRRHIVSAWNVGQISQMALPPCHMMFQFYVSGYIGNAKLSCQMYQRSADMFLGVPFNIASYALLTHMIAQVCGLDVGELIICFGDCHIYLNHLDQVNMMLSLPEFKLPELILDVGIKDIDDFKLENLKLIGYQHGPKIAASVAV